MKLVERQQVLLSLLFFLALTVGTDTVTQMHRAHCYVKPRGTLRRTVLLKPDWIGTGS